LAISYSSKNTDSEEAKMSGGGSSKPQNKEPAATPVTTTPLPAFMPGMDSMIAQQLGMGGYGDPTSLLAAMQAIHTPMNIPAFTPAKDTKPSSGFDPRTPRYEGRQQRAPTSRDNMFGKF
jgi:hypothetical protein